MHLDYSHPARASSTDNQHRDSLKPAQSVLVFASEDKKELWLGGKEGRMRISRRHHWSMDWELRGSQ